MSLELNKKITQALADAHARNDVPRVKELLSPKLVWHIGGVSKPMGREDYVKGMEEGFAAFSDPTFTIEQQIAEGDRVMNVFTIRMRHTGPFQGHAPSNRELCWKSFWLYKIVDHKIVELWLMEEDFLPKLT